MADDLTSPARRFLHLCYCTDDAASVVEFMAAGLGLSKKMETPMERNSGAIFGMDGDIESAAAFVYDPRGARRCPAIEVQEWADPAVVGQPRADATEVGIQALGYAVPDLDVAVGRLCGLGCTEVARGTGATGAPTAVLRDPTGVTLDLVEDASLDEPSALHHLRITVTDLDASVPWYQGVGWTEIERAAVTDAAALGADRSANGVVARLRLPDEPTETLLVQWTDPPSHGRHPAEAFHAGLFRAALGVDDTRASHAAMVADGWEFDRPPMEVELNGTPVPDMWICFISDPDGVPYEFVQRPRDAFRA